MTSRVGIAVLAAFAVLAVGCQNQAQTAQPTVAPQQTSTPQDTTAKTEQKSQTPTKISIRVDPWNGPSSDVAAMRDHRRGSVATSQPAERKVKADIAKGTGEVSGEDARYVQNVLVWIDTSASGSTGGTATGSSTGSQTTSPSQHVSPAQTATTEQRVKPEFTSSVPIAVGMPGSIQDQQSTAVSRGSTSTAEKTSTPTATTVTVKALSEQLASIIQAAQSLIAQLQATKSAATQPE